ncbi:MAG TPA: S4 domain-containing protein, partial [Terriglobales bacterium]|nr:S4 domain-containing protein [Terriglobales bacterium]
GREIQQEYGQRPQIVLTMPLLEGLDGVRKMSKSFGNYVGITEEPAAMFAKLMSISDELMWRYWLLLTDLGEADITLRRQAVAAGTLHPMEVKKDLAQQITADFHSAPAAHAARQEFERVVQGGAAPAEVADIAVALSDRLDKMLAEAALAPSVSEAARLIKSGSVSLAGVVQRESKLAAPLAPATLVKVGKHRFARLVSR